MHTKLVRYKLWLMGFVTMVGFICLSVSAGFAADEFPNRPVKFLVPFNPGGQSDIAVLLMRPGPYQHFCVT